MIVPLTPRGLHALAWRERTAARCLEAARRDGGAPDKRSPVPDVRTARAALDAVGARQLVPGDPEYADAFLELADPPACVFVRGRRLEPGTTGVAVVGARSCSAYGREVAEGIGRGLAAAGVTVVSGAAIGVDAASHRGALDAGGPTIAVLGSGIDVSYPARNLGLIEAVARHGSVVSEYPPGVRAQSWRFPARNRLIAALSRVVVVVEGAVGSGALITADFALDIGREVFAVPGPVTSPLSAAPLQLLCEGAGVVRGPEDVLEVLGRFRSRPDPRKASDAGDLTDAERSVMNRIVGAAVTADGVAAELSLPVGTVLSTLMSLEMRGLVRTVGGRYERVARLPR